MTEACRSGIPTARSGCSASRPARAIRNSPSYNEANTSTVIRGTLPTTYAQTGSSADYLDRYNLTYGVVETEPTAVNTPVAVTMKSMLTPVELHIRSAKYTSGWTVEQVTIEAPADQVLAGEYTFDLATEAYEFTGEKASKVTINLPSLPMSEEGVDAYMLSAAGEASTASCTFEVTIAHEEEGNLLLRGTHTLGAATELSVDSFESTVIGDEAIDLSKLNGRNETANCYIASQPGVTYKFPATVMGNGYTTPAVPGYTTNDGMAPGITPTHLDPKSAQVLWQTAPDLVSNVKLRNGYVYFTLNGEAGGGTLTAGNAVIAVYSEAGVAGEILWSWHIWVTDADLDNLLQTWTVHADAAQYASYRDPQLMDRNLGALTTAEFSESGTNESHGLHYQWGRKDPFMWSNNGNSVYNQTYVTAGLDLEDVTKTPYLIYGAKDSDGDWQAAEHRPDLWGGVNNTTDWYDPNGIGHKTIYDPCPAGYRVCDARVFNEVKKSALRWEFDNGMEHQSDELVDQNQSPFTGDNTSVLAYPLGNDSNGNTMYDYWPYSGAHWGSNDQWGNRTGSNNRHGAIYWANSVNPTTTSRGVIMQYCYFSATFDMAAVDAVRSQAFAIRCQKDTENR